MPVHWLLWNDLPVIPSCKMGEIQIQNTNAARILQDEFDKFSRYTEAKILLQKPEYANARSIMDFLIDRADANDEPVNWDLFAQYLSQVNKAGQTEKVKTEYRLIEGSLTYSSKYKDSLQNFFTEHLEDYSELFFSGVIKSITGDETSNTLVGSSKTDVVLGLAGDDTLEGNAGNDYLNGGLGNDKLYGGAGHDTLDGGTGNDRLYGGNNESDTYLFRAGHGRDVITDYASQDEQADTLRFAGAQLKNAQFSREGHATLPRCLAAPPSAIYTGPVKRDNACLSPAIGAVHVPFFSRS